MEASARAASATQHSRSTCGAHPGPGGSRAGSRPGLGGARVRVIIRRERHPAQQVDVALIWAQVARARVIDQAWVAQGLGSGYTASLRPYDPICAASEAQHHVGDRLFLSSAPGCAAAASDTSRGRQHMTGTLDVSAPAWMIGMRVRRAG